MNRIIEYYNLVTQVYQDKFWQSKEATEYMDKRGISKSVLLKSKIGFADTNHTLPKDQPEFVINESNLFYETGNDIFHKSVIFPCIVGGNTIFFSSRKLDLYVNGDKTRKHKHMSGKINFVYNQDILTEKKSIYLVEGCIDTLSILTHGRPAVGMLGANRINDDITQIFRGHTVFILFDSDENGAGQKASVRTAGILHRNKIDTKIVFLPANGHSYDINDFLLRHDIKELDYLAKHSIPFEKTEEYLEGRFKNKPVIVNGYVDITKVIKYYKIKIQLRNQRGFKIHCPFHKDDTASMQIYTDTNSFYCFGGGCSLAGSPVRFIELMEHCEKEHALQIYSGIVK